MKARAILSIVALLSCACGAHEPPTGERRADHTNGPASHASVGPHALGPRDASAPVDTGELAAATSSVPSPPSLHAEVVEADVVRVGSLRTISLEARELRVKDLKRVDHYPVAKDEGMVKLEGDLIEAGRLEAHHVRARLVVADEVIVHRFIKLRGESPWQRTGDGPQVVNRCVHLSERPDGAPARCTRGPVQAP